MTVVSTKEFNSDQEKYFDLAINERVYIKRGENVFLLINKNGDDSDFYHSENVYDEILSPDEEFRRTLSAEEFRNQLSAMLEDVDKKYANK
ncbi:MAG: hypothetical protein LBE56_03705 [Tannerella sp.]|jgi:hypothetical protein|nr:hypothetical protein [Tannerella sp.]